MKEFRIGALMAIFASLALSAAAQTPPPPKPATPGATPANAQPNAPTVAPCPQLQIQVQTPMQPVRDGAPVKMAAVISGGDPAVTATFSWSLSSGMMTDGQGTRNISVDSTGAGGDRQIIADVLVGGYAPECIVQATTTVPVAAPAKKVDEFGDLAEKEETEHLDRYVQALSPTHEQAYIFAYAGRNNVRGYANESLKRIRAYVVKAGFPSGRIVAIDGGFREQPAYELWVVAVGAEPPRSSPTVDRKDIVYPKPAPVIKKP